MLVLACCLTFFFSSMQEQHNIVLPGPAKLINLPPSCKVSRTDLLKNGFQCERLVPRALREDDRMEKFASLLHKNCASSLHGPLGQRNEFHISHPSQISNNLDSIEPCSTALGGAWGVVLKSHKDLPQFYWLGEVLWGECAGLCRSAFSRLIACTSVHSLLLLLPEIVHVYMHVFSP